MNEKNEREHRRHDLSESLSMTFSAVETMFLPNITCCLISYIKLHHFHFGRFAMSQNDRVRKPRGKVLLSVTLFFALLLVQFALMPSVIVEAYFGGWELIGAYVDGVYYDADEAQVFMTICFEEDYVGWARTRMFEYGELVYDQTEDFTYDVSQSGGIIINGEDSFYIYGDSATMYSLGGGSDEYYFMSWDALDATYPGDTDYPDEPAPQPVEPEPEPEPEPLPPVQPETEGPRPTGLRLKPVIRPKETAPQPATQDRGQFDQPYKDKPGVRYEGPFMILADPEAYFADLPALYDYQAKQLLVPTEPLLDQISNLEKLHIDVWPLPENKPSGPEIFAAAWNHLSLYPLVGAELILKIDGAPSLTIHFTLDVPAMPGQRTTFAGGIPVAADGAEIPSPISLEAVIPYKLSLTLLDGLRGTVTLTYDFEQGVFEATGTEMDAALKGLRPATPEENETCRKLIESITMSEEEDRTINIGLKNAFASPISLIESEIVRSDSQTVSVRFDPVNHPAPLQGGAQLEAGKYGFWRFGLMPSSYGEILTVPFINSILRLRFPSGDATKGDLEVTYFPTLSMIRIERLAVE
jgi:hypothetical protein